MPNGNSGTRSPSAGSERDSHDLSISGGRGRDSLLDNLLLSFDKIGDSSLGAFDASPYFSNIDEVDDDSSSVYSRERSNSTSNYNAAGSGYGSRRLGSVDHGYGDGYGTYDGGRDTRSRGRGLGSSHGYHQYDPYDAAPAPSIRSGPRNRSPSPPRSPRLVRRPSNKSIKSLRSRDQQLQFDDPITLPPLPAFANPPPPAPSAPMGNSSKQSASSKPGFFRRVFGGGGSSSNSSANAKTTAATTAAASPAPVVPTSQQPAPEQPQVITKKASFFRRRKKSVTDAINVPPVPESAKVADPDASHATPSIGPSPAMSSPVNSLRAAMNPYLNSPLRPAHVESSAEEREPSYHPKDATIRTVASSDSVSPRRPSFFAESPRQRDGGSYFGELPGDGGSSLKKYKKETWNAKGDAQMRPATEGVDSTDPRTRPQTSPTSSPYIAFNEPSLKEIDEKEPEMYWPPSPRRGVLTNTRSNDSSLHDSDRKSSIPTSVSDKPRQDSQPIINVKDIEQVDGNTSDTGKGGYLSLDTESLGEQANRMSLSWLGSPSVGSRGSRVNSVGSGGMPTVTLQSDGPGAKAEVLEQHDEVTNTSVVDEPDAMCELEPTEDDREVVQKIYDGEEEPISKDKATAWLGDGDPARAGARKAYLELFDFTQMNILTALRMFCGRLVFRAESQQVDRVMVALSKRWCECNPNHGFKSADIVHTILYSILLLNTDMHIMDAPSSQKMTKGQFIKNTMTTVRRMLIVDPYQHDNQSGTIQSAVTPRSQTPFRRDSADDSPTASVPQSSTFPLATRDRKGHESRPSMETPRNESRGNRLSRLGNISPRLPSEGSVGKTDYDVDGNTALVNEPLIGGIRIWETQVEIVLKDIYQSLRTQPLPLHGAPQERLEPASSFSNMLGPGMLRRSPSNISRAASEMSGMRSRDSTKLGAKWASKNRSHQRLHYNGSFAGSSRTSLDERSLWSPSASSTWSKYSLDKTQTSMSVDSFGSAFTHGDYQQSIGFASALSHAIIREENASAHSAEEDVNILDADEQLELAGAPWAKEGMVKHKHHLESVEKRAKSRAWTECFAVVEKGYLRLFLFPTSKSSGKNTQNIGGIVGGGNWLENAEQIGTFLLRQSIASALPPPGYSKSRPNVWALSLPSGAVHFFEVGTAEIVREFVSTANYWSARLSKEPLVGGVSNVEYGWSDSIIDMDAVRSPPESGYGDGPRPSLQMSIRSSIDHGAIRPRLPGDKVVIRDWMPPAQSMVASSLEEGEQLKALENYVANIEAELQKHQDLRPAMIQAFSPRHPNAAKALNNWEKKSSYLLREIVKFRTYIDGLQTAIDKRGKLKSDRIAEEEAAGKSAQ